MMNVNNFIFFIATVCCTFSLSAQSTSEKLKKEQLKLERSISSTKTLLNKSKENTELSLKELQLLKSQIKFRERLLKNYDNQIRSAELTIERKEIEIEELHKKIERLKEQYKALLIYAYKHRNKYGSMMYVFSSDNYYEAIKRKKYLDRIAEIQKKQFLIIRQNQSLIEEEIAQIEKERAFKTKVVGQKIEEKSKIEKDKIDQEKLYVEFKSKEDDLLNQLKKDEAKKAELKRQITLAIEKEIREAEARRKKAEAEARRKREEAARKAKAENKEPEKISFPDLNADKVLSNSFSENRGKLPWPVDKGSLTEKFGKNPHPTLNNVFTNNRGIDIGAPKNAQVKAVFEGEVTSVLNIPGAGKVVIIKHGNYRTVYSNLKDTYVTKGMKVKRSTVIGSLLVKDGENLSEVHFEIHKVENGSVTCLNPSLWVSH